MTPEEFGDLYASTLALKERYVASLNALQDAARACRNFRNYATAKLASDHPDWIKESRANYEVGERIKNEMQIGGRWPQKATGGTYTDTLRSVPIDQRSPELTECLRAWEKWSDVQARIEAAYPPPPHFWWNGVTLCGPNLYSDFGITEIE